MEKTSQFIIITKAVEINLKQSYINAIMLGV